MKTLKPYLISSLLILLITGCGTSDESSKQENPQHKAIFIDNNMTGKMLFSHEFTPLDGLGPHFNAKSCVECHSTPEIGGVGEDKDDLVFRIGFLSEGIFSDLTGEGGPSARTHSVSEDGYICSIANGIGQNVNVISLRKSLSLFGLGVIDSIPDTLIEAEAIDKGYGIHGKINKILNFSGDYTVGKFGWKAQKSDLLLFTAEAFRNEIGMTNLSFPNDNFKPNTPSLNECEGFNKDIEISNEAVKKVHDFIASLPIKHAGTPDFYSKGYTAFQEAKCDLCHKPSYIVNNKEHYLFTDLLLHDMGDGLNDNFVQVEAKGMDWRTAPLHGLGFRTQFLHDGRTDSLNRAILEHRGEADQSIMFYSNFSQEKKDDLISFLKTL